MDLKTIQLEKIFKIECKQTGGIPKSKNNKPPKYGSIKEEKNSKPISRILYLYY